jgi:hypothetical protein
MVYKKTIKRKHINPNRTKKNKVKEIIIKKKKMSDEEIANQEGEYFDESHYDKIIKYNADVYYITENNEKKLLGRFRKKVIPKELCNIAFKNLKEASMKHHDNRGAAAGKVKQENLPGYANDPNLWIKVGDFRVSGYVSKITGKKVNNSIGNLSQSNIIGYFDKPDRNIKINAPQCRTTAFTSQQVDKWKNVIPYIKSVDQQFKKLIPDKHKLQFNRAKKTPFYIKGTAFSTVTINYNWRTALHRDAGDFEQGYGNLMVLEEGKYKGGYTGFPQFGVAFDVRNGDFLAMDVHEWHCNTKLEGKDFSRVSVVAYLREKMIKCKGMKLN